MPTRQRRRGTAGRQGCRMLTSDYSLLDYSLLPYSLKSLTGLFLARVFLMFFDCLILGSFILYIF